MGWETVEYALKWAGWGCEHGKISDYECCLPLLFWGARSMDEFQPSSRRVN